MNETGERPSPPSFADQKESVVARKFMALTLGFWRRPGSARAWALSLGLCFALLAVLIVDVGINRFQSALFNALERKDVDRVWSALLTLPLIVIGGAAAGVCVVWTREVLQVRWREWVTATLVTRWAGENRYRRIQTSGVEPANPEYRIADDVRMALDPLVDFAIGLFSAILGAATFIGILWTIGGGMTIPLGGSTLHVPAFMVIAALIYGVGVSMLAVFIGRPLVGRVARRNEAEAKLRFELTRLREHAALVEALGGGRDARKSIANVYELVVERWIAMIWLHARLTWVTNGSGVLIPLLPLALAAPKYLAGGLTLGDVVSLAAAFVKVQGAITWLVDNFRQVAQWYASAGRVVDLMDAMDVIDGESAKEAESPVAATALAE
ncbi:SbmA/BacA-like family transporter [Terrarubrum flagellatum]|uniref:SbmA/BacA-like family transporter n=1 Tax=Terrirubrum flagellatum TaxID=2895980 RepID=UPI0031454768